MTKERRRLLRVCLRLYWPTPPLPPGSSPSSFPCSLQDEEKEESESEVGETLGAVLGTEGLPPLESVTGLLAGRGVNFPFPWPLRLKMWKYDSCAGNWTQSAVSREQVRCVAQDGSSTSGNGYFISYWDSNLNRVNPPFSESGRCIYFYLNYNFILWTKWNKKTFIIVQG